MKTRQPKAEPTKQQIDALGITFLTSPTTRPISVCSLPTSPLSRMTCRMYDLESERERAIGLGWTRSIPNFHDYLVDFNIPAHAQDFLVFFVFLRRSRTAQRSFLHAASSHPPEAAKYNHDHRPGSIRAKRAQTQ